MPEPMTDAERSRLESDKLLERVLQDIGGPLPRLTRRCLPIPALEPWREEPEDGRK